LNRRQFVADDLLQSALKLRISVITKLCRKTHDSRFTYPNRKPEFAGRHKRRFIIVLYYKFRYKFLTFRKMPYISLDPCDQIVQSNALPFFSVLQAALKLAAKIFND